MAAPKLFVSYSWTGPDHEDWVLSLATDLRESGVDVILDKWDLKEGHDANAFMERMVTDPEIKKVILVCDKAYVDKTDGRSGGVGTEAQIISAEIYEEQAQDKFVAVVTELDENGKPYRPAYYRSRIYIDMTDPSRYGESFDQILRWAHDQPLHIKPELGAKPAFLLQDEGAVALATTSRHRRAMDALTNHRDHAIPAVADYFSTLTEELEKLRIDPAAEPFDDAVVQSIEEFLPYRNEAIEIFLALARNLDSEESRVALNRFLEGLIPYTDRPPEISQWRTWDWDNFKFIVQELFLYVVACLIRYERFDAAAFLLETEYYVPGNSARGENQMVPFIQFRNFLESLADRNRRLKLNRSAPHADLLKERCKGVGIEFRQLMQADFVLFLRSKLQQDGNHYWWPETLVYIGSHAGPFEIFARSRSMRYFDRAKVLLGIENKDALLPLLTAFSEETSSLPNWNYFRLDPARLLGSDELATKP